MREKRTLILPGFICGAVLLFGLISVHAQVSPAEIKDPGLRVLEQSYLQHLVALNQAITEMSFPFKLSLNRHVGLDPKDQIGVDMRGLEFVTFNERALMKITGNYNAAFNADLLTPNQRAGRVLNDVVLPMLRLLPGHFGQDESFDGFGFEIGYHVRRHNSSYEYEGKEILVIVFDKSDGLQYAGLREDAARQEILNRSEIYLSGKPFGLALNTDSPFDVEALVHQPARKASNPPVRSTQPKAPKEVPSPSASAESRPPVPSPPLESRSPAPSIPAKPVVPSLDSSAVNATLDALDKKYQPQIESLSKEGAAKYNFVEYAPPSFIALRGQIALQVTLRNPEPFDKDATSIYRRAARTFDLFLALRLRWLLEKFPDSADFSILDVSVVNELTSPKPGKSSEAIEFILPLKETRQFVAADITNQDVIDKSIVLVNGVRIALNLAQVE